MTRKNHNKKPHIKIIENIQTSSVINGKPVHNSNVKKILKDNKLTITGNINGVPIKKKVRFPHDLISPHGKVFTSKKNSYPKSILKKTHNKTVKKYPTHPTH